MLRENQRITDREIIVRLLSDSPVMRIAMNTAEGPYIVPLHFVYLQGAVYFHSAVKGRKLEALAADPRICGEIDTFEGIVENEKPCDFNTLYRSVIFSGTAAPVEDPPEKGRVLAALAEKYGYRGAPVGPGQCAGVRVMRIEISELSARESDAY